MVVEDSDHTSLLYFNPYGHHFLQSASTPWQYCLPGNIPLEHSLLEINAKPSKPGALMTRESGDQSKEHEGSEFQVFHLLWHGRESRRL